MGYSSRCASWLAEVPRPILTPRQDLVSRLTVDDPVVNNGVLQVAHSIFKRWRPLFRSDDLYIEINHVLTKFGGPFLTLLEVSRLHWAQQVIEHF